MPKGRSGSRRPPTPRDIAAYGHVAIAIREAMQRKGITSIREISRAIGKPAHYSPPYLWIEGRGAPGNSTAPAVAKFLDVPVESIMRRTLPEDRPRALAAMERTPLIAGPMPQPAGRPPRAGEVMSFVANADGEVRVRLDVTLPLAKAMPLFRILMDAGVVIAGGDPEAE